MSGTVGMVPARWRFPTFLADITDETDPSSLDCRVDLPQPNEYKANAIELEFDAKAFAGFAEKVDAPPEDATKTDGCHS